MLAPNVQYATNYRNDGILPIVVKKYLEEVRIDSSSWQQISRLMLIYWAIQQCARLALSINFVTKLEAGFEKN
jgi:hypothetical protein